jgi:hypothetical protein
MIYCFFIVFAFLMRNLGQNTIEYCQITTKKAASMKRPFLKKLNSDYLITFTFFVTFPPSEEVTLTK